MIAGTVSSLSFFLLPLFPLLGEFRMAPAECQSLVLAWSAGQQGDDWLGEYGLPIGEGKFLLSFFSVANHQFVS